MHGHPGCLGRKRGWTYGERWNHWEIPEAHGKKEGLEEMNDQNLTTRRKKSQSNGPNLLMDNSISANGVGNLRIVTFSICGLASCKLAVVVLFRSLVKHLRVVVLAGLGGANRVSPPSPLRLCQFQGSFFKFLSAGLGVKVHDLPQAQVPFLSRSPVSELPTSRFD